MVNYYRRWPRALRPGIRYAVLYEDPVRPRANGDLNYEICDTYAKTVALARRFPGAMITKLNVTQVPVLDIAVVAVRDAFLGGKATCPVCVRPVVAGDTIALIRWDTKQYHLTSVEPTEARWVHVDCARQLGGTIRVMG